MHWSGFLLRQGQTEAQGWSSVSRDYVGNILSEDTTMFPFLCLSFVLTAAPFGLQTEQQPCACWPFFLFLFPFFLLLKVALACC